MKKISWGFIDLARFCVCSLAVLSGGIGCGGGEDDDNSERPSNSNLECEQCVVGVLDESVACLQTADTCVATCVDVNDDDCIEGCKTTAYYCRQDSTLCGLTCPCYLQFAECLVGAEKALKDALDEKGIPYVINPGDGAFYGPKIDFHIRDVLKRSWQCGTIQLDFSMPERFGLTYVGKDGEKHTPVMIHRACYGSLERFLGIIIENFAGAFPLWLAPVQVEVIPVSEKFEEYAKKVTNELLDAGMRVHANLSDDRVGYKIRESSLKKIPFAIIVGEKEVEAGTINVRDRDSGDQKETTIADFIASIDLTPPKREPAAQAAE